MRHKIRIFTEGPTDIKHLQASLNYFQQKLGQYLDWEIEFRSQDGEKDLQSACRTSAREPQDVPIIAIFDNDLKGDKSKVHDKSIGYKRWSDNVFSFVIPIPEHRAQNNQICIEHYYLDQDLLRPIPMDSNRRLFLGEEFHEESGTHLKENSHTKSTNDIKRNWIISSEQKVFKGHENIAASKQKFADYITYRQECNEPVDFSQFALIFECIQKITQDKMFQRSEINISRPTIIDWQGFIDKSISDLKWNFDGPDADYYYPIKIQDGIALEEAEISLRKAIENSQMQGVLLHGPPGSGKSYQLERILFHFLDALQRNVDTFNESRYDPYTQDDNSEQSAQIFKPSPNSIVPILLRLNLYDSSNADLSSQIQKFFDTDQFVALSYLGQQEFTTVLLIDEIDEVSSIDYEKNLSTIRKFVSTQSHVPNVKILVAGREHAARRFVKLFSKELSVAPLEPQDAQQLISEYYANTDVGGTNRERTPDSFFRWLEQYPQLIEVLKTPLLAIEAFSRWHRKEAANVYQLLNKIISSLVYREDMIEDAAIELHMKALEKLAIQCLPKAGQISRTIKEEIGSEHVEWLQHMGFVSYSATTTQFVNPWLYASIVVRVLEFEGVLDESLTPQNYLNRYCANDDLRQKCITLLEMIENES